MFFIKDISNAYLLDSGSNERLVINTSMGAQVQVHKSQYNSNGATIPVIVEGYGSFLMTDIDKGYGLSQGWLTEA